MVRPRPAATAILLAVALAGSPSAEVRGGPDAVLSLDPSTTYQTITGWEAVAWAANDSPAFESFIGEVARRAIEELGITRVRLEVRAGAENRRDYWSEYRAGTIDYPTWRCNRYATVNDDADPETIDWSGFHFSELDWTVEHIVLPLRDAAERAGERLFVNVNYVAFTGQIQCGGAYLHDDPQEYAEFVLAAHLHLRDRFGLVLDAWEVLLEPDNVSQWDGALLGRAVVAAARRLEESGFRPRFIAPSTTNMGNAPRYFDAMVAAAPDCLDFLSEISYHRYGGVSAANLQAIVERAERHGLQTSMLEWWSSANTRATLHQDLKEGRNSAWERGVLAGTGAPDNSAKLYAVDVSDPERPQVHLNHGSRYLQQTFRYVRPGAVRIGAQTTNASFDPLAFRNPAGEVVVVIQAGRGGSLAVADLPAGTYGIRYTTGTGNDPPSAYGVELPEVTLRAGESLEAAIPAAGVMTIFARPPAAGLRFLRGDCDGDGELRGSVNDAVANFRYCFAGRPVSCVAACDSDADGNACTGVSDGILILLYLFRGGVALPEPFPDCGPSDLASDAKLGCEQSGCR